MTNLSSQDIGKDTAAWTFQVWASFVLSLGSTSIGILYLPVDPWIRAFLGLGLFFAVGSSLSLAKTLRDAHESRRVLNRLAEAKTEKILREFDTQAA